MTNRNPTDVIDQVLAVVPSDQRSLRALLEKVRSDDAYVAPEAKRTTWVALAHVLGSNLNWPLREDWEREVHAIVKGEATAGEGDA